MSVPTKTGLQICNEINQIWTNKSLETLREKLKKQKWVLLEDHQKEKKEIVKDIISFSVTTNSRTELQCKIINGFGVLFDTNLKDVPEANDQTSNDDLGVVGKAGKPPQSPKTRDHILVDKDKPSQIVVSESPSERVSKNPVGVSSLCQKCGHEKDNHIKKGFYFDDCINCSCSGFVEKTK